MTEAWDITNEEQHPAEPWTIAEYDARVVVRMGDGRHFEMLLGQSRGRIPTKAEALEAAATICNSVNLIEHPTTVYDGRQNNGGLPKRENLKGQKFGRLRVKFFVGVSRSRKAIWRCLCDCGKTKNVEAQKLKIGKALSCGCLRRAMDNKS